MQANQNIGIAVIPFMKGSRFASVCSDGNHHAVMLDGVHKEFTSLWWAVEYIQELGFEYDWETFKQFSLSSFVTLCAPRGYYYKNIGGSWHAYKDGRLVHIMPTKWECQFMCIRDCYTSKF